MKEFVMLKTTIIRTSLINVVSYDFTDKSELRQLNHYSNLFKDEYFIRINDGEDKHSYNIKYTDYNQYIRERTELERVLLEIEPKKTRAKTKKE